MEDRYQQLLKELENAQNEVEQAREISFYTSQDIEINILWCSCYSNIANKCLGVIIKTLCYPILLICNLDLP